jgi:hypothetical protein
MKIQKKFLSANLRRVSSTGTYVDYLSIKYSSTMKMTPVLQVETLLTYFEARYFPFPLLRLGRSTK